MKIDDDHRRPDGATDNTVEAVGKLSEALEWLERARGVLYEFHQMLGHLDFQMGDAVDKLRAAGHESQAALVENEIVGRNVLEGRWTFQIIEEFEALYYDVVKDVEKQVRDELMDGKRHVFEAELKKQRTPSGARGAAFG